jgi:hypothetical protein
MQHTNKTLATETLAKRLKTLESRCKHMQHRNKTLAIYA